MTGQAEHGINRRDFLKFGAAFTGKFAVDAAFPHLSKAETPSDWNPVLIRQGDTFTGICKFYGITKESEMDSITVMNGIKNTDVIYAGNPLYLPKSKNELINSFCQLLIDVDDGKFNTGYRVLSQQTYSDVDFFNYKITNNGVFYHGINWPGVFAGHSVINREESGNFPFDVLMRKMIGIKEKELPQRVRVAAARYIDMQGGNWLEAKVIRMGYYGSPGEFSYTLPQAEFYNCNHLILVTCVPESGKKDDRLYAIAKITTNNIVSV